MRRFTLLIGWAKFFTLPRNGFRLLLLEETDGRREWRGVARLELDQTAPAGDGDGFGAAEHIQLGEDIAEMG